MGSRKTWWGCGEDCWAVWFLARDVLLKWKDWRDGEDGWRGSLYVERAEASLGGRLV